MFPPRHACILGLVFLSVAYGVSAQPRPDADQLADLEVYSLGLTDKGSVIYQIGNRGKEGSERPFVVEVYINGVRKDAITHQPLPALSLQTAESNLARFTDCKAGTVRLVIDPQNAVREASKANNERVTALTPPACGRPPR
jgi:subtilase family serine protease